jgi:hypothetical protein
MPRGFGELGRTRKSCSRCVSPCGQFRSCPVATADASAALTEEARVSTVTPGCWTVTAAVPLFVASSVQRAVIV